MSVVIRNVALGVAIGSTGISWITNMLGMQETAIVYALWAILGVLVYSEGDSQ